MKKLWIVLFALLLSGCGAQAPAAPAVERVDWSSLQKTGSMQLDYATEFAVDYYSDGYAFISVTDGNDYVLVPEGGAEPSGLAENVTVIHQPVQNIYLVATSAMDLYRAAGGLDRIKLSCLEESGWYIPEAREAMASGAMIYAGKYSAPDYELIYSQGCDLAVESTMVYHVPEVKEQLERLGIPVFIERSSYEKNPLGRMEWMKLHALLVGREQEAEAVFRQEIALLEPVLGQESTGKTVAFFAVNANGSVTVRKSGDYIARTIQMAGGEYIFSDLGDDSSALSTVNLQMEAFYDGAKDADILIYNSTLNGELQTMEQLLAQSALLSQFKAVQNGSVWCTGQNLFQEGMGLGRLILEINQILNGEAGELRFLHRLT